MSAYDDAKRRLDGIAKPLDGLGRFEELICRIAAIQGTADIDISKRIVVMMCADNGVIAEGISQSSWDVTAKVAASMSEGRSSVCLMAERAGADTLPVDVGIKEKSSLTEYEGLTAGPRGHYKLLSRSVAEGTADFMEEPAMTESEFDLAFSRGTELLRELSGNGYRIVCTGEMGIGNTTTSAALAAGLLRLTGSETAGRGAGLDDKGYRRKVEVIDIAINKYGLYELTPKAAACAVGGLDIAALAGMYAEGARLGIPIVIDGMISAAAALLAARLHPGCAECMLPSHIGGEKGMVPLMKELKLTPVIDAGLKLGEGTGAVMLLPMLDMALAVYNGSALFGDIGVGQYVRHGDKDA